MAEIEAHNLAQPGDVLVSRASISCPTWAACRPVGQRQGEIGAIVDGGVRDIDHRAASATPSGPAASARSPASGGVETVAVNKSVTICGVAVAPGDLVLADETGVCFIPRARRRGAGARTQVAEKEKVCTAEDRSRRAGGGICCRGGSGALREPQASARAPTALEKLRK